jgi:hypothetical protein
VREAYVEWGEVNEEDVVDFLAKAILEKMGDPFEVISAEAVSTTMPITGQTITVGSSTQRVKRVTVSEDEQGVVTIRPELQDRRRDELENIQAAIKRLADGSMNGTARTARRGKAFPVPVRRVRTYELPPFTQTGPVRLQASNAYQIPFPMRLTHLTVMVKTAGSTNTVVRVYTLDGPQDITATLLPGKKAITVPFALEVDSLNAVALMIEEAGTGAVSLTGQIRASSVG